jgi:hypothetical protein
MRYFFVALVFCLFACQEQKVNLPQFDQTFISEIVDHSAIYFFYESENKDNNFLRINDHNRIGTTNWVFHIDKNLALKEVIPALNGFQEKRKNAEMHKKEGYEHYFSYSDSIKKAIAFCKFTVTNYAYNNYFSSLYVKENAAYHQDFELITVNFASESTVYINGELIDLPEVKSYILEYLDFQNSTNKALLYLNFEQKCSFGFYLKQYLAMQSLISENRLIASTQFIYDENLLTSCDCK